MGKWLICETNFAGLKSRRWWAPVQTLRGGEGPANVYDFSLNPNKVVCDLLSFEIGSLSKLSCVCVYVHKSRFVSPGAPNNGDGGDDDDLSGSLMKQLIESPSIDTYDAWFSFFIATLLRWTIWTHWFVGGSLCVPWWTQYNPIDLDWFRKVWLVRTDFRSSAVCSLL